MPADAAEPAMKRARVEEDAFTLRLSGHPCSWGVDYADSPHNPPWDEVIKLMAEAGYAGTELGPVGYFDPERLGELLKSTRLELVAGNIFEKLHEPSEMKMILEKVHSSCKTLQKFGAKFFVIVPHTAPEKEATAGRPKDAPRLPDARWVLPTPLRNASQPFPSTLPDAMAGIQLRLIHSAAVTFAVVLAGAAEEEATCRAAKEARPSGAVKAHRANALIQRRTAVDFAHRRKQRSRFWPFDWLFGSSDDDEQALAPLLKVLDNLTNGSNGSWASAFGVGANASNASEAPGAGALLQRRAAAGLRRKRQRSWFWPFDWWFGSADDDKPVLKPEPMPTYPNIFEDANGANASNASQANASDGSEGDASNASETNESGGQVHSTNPSKIGGAHASTKHHWGADALKRLR